MFRKNAVLFRCGDPRIAQPEGRFAETGHEDMAKNFAEYPQKWKLKRPTATSITVGCLIWKPGLAAMKNTPHQQEPQ